MAFSDILMTFSEIVGTVAFAISGASLAVRYRLDLFGCWGELRPWAAAQCAIC